MFKKLTMFTIKEANVHNFTEELIRNIRNINAPIDIEGVRCVHVTIKEDWDGKEHISISYDRDTEKEKESVEIYESDKSITIWKD